jgi:hypothetical protein
MRTNGMVIVEKSKVLTEDDLEDIISGLIVIHPDKAESIFEKVKLLIYSY